MTDYKTLSDSELTEALNFHRRQRNLSNGINEAAHMRQTQVVRLLEAEEARRLEEAEQIDELSKKTLGSYIKKAGGTSLDSAGAHMADYGANKNPKSFKKGINRAKGVMQAADRLTKEEVEQIDELSKKTLGSYVKKASTDQYLKGQAVQYHTNKANDSKGSAFEKESKKKHMNAADDALRKASNRDTGIGRAVDRLTKEEVELDEASKPNQYIEVINKFTGAKTHHEVHPSKAFAALNHHNRLWNTKSARIVSGKEAEEIKASKMKKEEVEQIDEISTDLKNKYMDKAVADHTRLTKSWSTSSDKQGVVNKMLKRSTGVLRAQGVNMKQLKTNEEVEIDEAASYRDRGYANMLKADRKAEKELAKLRAQQAKDAAKASKPEEFKEESNLRITKVYNKWPKPATYAVHNADRSYHKEFDSMEAAQAHKAEKSK